MENKVLQENIEQIKHYNNKLSSDILMFNLEGSNINICQNENGQYNILYNSIPLHSTSDAILEAKTIANNFKDSENSIKVIYGLGLGYLLEEASNKINLGKIIVYEPNLDLLKFVFSIAKIDSIFKKNVFICSDKNTLCDYISQLTNENTDISISFLTSYKNLYFDDIKSVLEKIQQTQGEIIANKNTLKKKSDTTLYYTFANLKKVLTSPNVTDLKNIYQGKTALIIAAGPSLKENIEIIRNNQNKFVIFALNPTLKLLQEYNIKPDFIVNVESFNNLKQFSEIDIKECYCIFEDFCSYQVHSLNCRKVFNYISHNNFFNYWVRDCLKLNDNLETLGTVSYSALMSAHLMGFNRIILIGQDLAYKNGECYSKSSSDENIECVYNKETKKYEITTNDFDKFANLFRIPKRKEETVITLAKRRLNFLNKNICTVKSQDGNDIPTQSGYSMFIKYFESSALKIKKENPNVELINSSTGGAQIDNWENVKLNDIVPKLENVEKLNLDNYNPTIDKEHISNKISKLVEQITIYSNLVINFIETNKKLTQELKNKNIFTKNAQKFLQKHLDILHSIFDLKKQQDIGYIINMHFFLVEKYLIADNFEDIKKSIDRIEKLNIACERIKYLCSRYTLLLNNCKSFILK